MLWSRVGREILVVVHRPIPIAELEWGAFLTHARNVARAAGGVKVLVRSEGHGGPDAGQRAVLGELCRGIDMQVAVLTHSRTIRGIARAVSWLGTVTVEAFVPSEVANALEWLRAPAADRDQMIAVLRLLERRAVLSTVA
jgi:hypothetical protein